MTSGMKEVLDGDMQPVLSEKYLMKRSRPEPSFELEDDEQSTPSTICAIEANELNPVERAFFRAPRSPNFIIHTDK
jgi:hypothetical protein